MTATPVTTEYVQFETAGRLGLITLTRAKALNALSHEMVRALIAQLLHWRSDPNIAAVLVRGSDKNGPFGHFCAGGDIRFLHASARAGDGGVDDFFTEEYALNHLIYTYPKPYIAFMDGVVMGGGMGISQGARLRIVTDKTRMAMPETIIGLFPDVGAGYFLSRCPGHTGQWLGLTGQTIDAPLAVAMGLADLALPANTLPALWAQLCSAELETPAHAVQIVREFAAQHALFAAAPSLEELLPLDDINRIFALPTMVEIVQTLEAQGAAGHDWARETAAMLRQRSPLMLHVTLEHLRRSRSMDVASVLRVDRALVRHCFAPLADASGNVRAGSSQTVEGIRAQVIDKDRTPRWQPARVEDVSAEQCAAFFQPPWPAHLHPLRQWL